MTIARAALTGASSILTAARKLTLCGRRCGWSRANSPKPALRRGKGGVDARAYSSRPARSFADDHQRIGNAHHDRVRDQQGDAIPSPAVPASAARRSDPWAAARLRVKATFGPAPAAGPLLVSVTLILMHSERLKRCPRFLR